jgi:hypothetical protein
MKTLKLVLAVGALVLGSLAFAQESKTDIYSAHGVFGSCTLKVIWTGDQVDFQVPSQSKIKFAGMWPAEAGTVSMQGYWKLPSKSQFLGPDDLVEADASLKVTFAEVTVDGQTSIQPRSFEYVDLDMAKTAGIITHTCHGLVKVK